MNKEENKDYVFYMNWEDRLKQNHKVGILAKIEEDYYFFIKNKQRAEAAYRAGFIGVSGFKPERIYRSKELFDFFKSRIIDKNSEEPCKELSKTKAISMVDSFSVDEIKDDIGNKYKKIILQAYELQEKRNELEQEIKRQNEGENKETEGIHNI